MSETAADVVSECERLARDIGRLCLADVLGEIATTRTTIFSRYPSRQKSIPERLRFGKMPAGVVDGWGMGIEIMPQSPSSLEQWRDAPLFYDAAGQPVVNSNGESLVFDPGWRTVHEYHFEGEHAKKAAEQIDHLSEWARNRWSVLRPILFPDRRTKCWLFPWADIVNQVAELAHDATLPKPEWSVIVGALRERWPVWMWKRRDDEEYQGFGPRYSEEDFARIGDEPEEVFCWRANILRDSETAIEWIGKQLSIKRSTPVVDCVNQKGHHRQLGPWSTVTQDDPSSGSTKLQQMLVSTNANAPATLVGSEMESVNQAALRVAVDAGLAGVIQAAAGSSAVERCSTVMQKSIDADNSRYEWRADDWVETLGASKKTILNTPAWKMIMRWRAENKSRRTAK